MPALAGGFISSFEFLVSTLETFLCEFLLLLRLRCRRDLQYFLSSFPEYALEHIPGICLDPTNMSSPLKVGHEGQIRLSSVLVPSVNL